MLDRSEKNILADAGRSLFGAFASVAVFSAAVNLLMLTGPLFMLQVYDRVLASQSVPTLTVLFALVVILFLFLAAFDFVRARILSRSAHRFDEQVTPAAQKCWIFQGLVGVSTRSQPVSDVSLVRQFLAGRGLVAFFDLPWTPFYIYVVFLVHEWLGLFAIVGALIVVGLTVLEELSTRRPVRDAAPFELSENLLGQQLHRNASMLVAMGMTDTLRNLWSDMRSTAMAHSQRASAITESLGAFTKAIRMITQSGVLALGAWLVIQQEVSPGAMIAASIITGRALAPIDQVIASWRGFARARLAYARLKQALGGTNRSSAPIDLPAPEGKIVVQNATKLAPADIASQPAKPILQDLTFALEPGDGLGVVGPSASGKSSLARLLVGIWMPDRGAVRLDGATFDLWDREKLGRYIGYLPQEIGLIAGSIGQNISRFLSDSEDADIVAAAKLAGVHELILALPGGYDAKVSGGQLVLSGGQVQRIALARAVFGKPCLVVLDEPNSNLDADGDAALTTCIETLRNMGTSVVVMAHRPSAIAAVNKILMLREGRQVEFGDKADVLRKVTKR